MHFFIFLYLYYIVVITKTNNLMVETKRKLEKVVVTKI